jgi:hypothetical protein
LARKQNQIPIGSVLFSYVGSDHDFDKFLKSVVHDYLAVSDLSAPGADNSIAKVEFSDINQLSVAL